MEKEPTQVAADLINQIVTGVSNLVLGTFALKRLLECEECRNKMSGGCPACGVQRRGNETHPEAAGEEADDGGGLVRNPPEDEVK